MDISVADIKKLREQTGAGIADCRKALEEAKGDFGKAKELLQSWGIDKAASKADRVVGAGLVDTYIHSGGKVGAMIEINCETDFVARTDDFKNLCHELSMQVAAMNPKDIEELFKQTYIRDSSVTIEQLVKSTIAKVGENIVVKRFMRFELGSE